MDKFINSGSVSGSGCYGHHNANATLVAAAPTIAATKHCQRLSNNNNFRARQQQQQQQLINTTVGRAGNSSPKLAATFQGMSVNVVQSAATILPKQAQIIGQQRQATPNNNNNNLNHNQKLLKPPGMIEQQQQPTIVGSVSGIIRTKPRNKSEEAIGDLLQRIPDIGHIFDVHSRIGNGTFSTVLLATLKRESYLPDSKRRKFAIKHHIPTSHPDRIMKELQCMTDMGGTDNVVGIHCCLRCDASAAFVMPYMPHDRFHDFYTKMDVPEIRMYMRNLLLALRHVHKFNIIHRDVKPSNFLYNRRQGQFLLVDFGLAQHVNVNSSSTTASMLNAASQQPTLQVQKSCTGILSSKRPRERDSLVSASQQQQQQQQQGASVTDVQLGGAVKRMRLIEETTSTSSNCWSKMPLKPVNEIAQSSSRAAAAELPSDNPKQSDAINASQSQIQAQTVPTTIAPAATAVGAEAGATPATAANKYNTNRGAGGGGAVGSGGKCYCFANPSVCLNCLMKKEVHASRAGTPGYRPPEVLLKYADQTTAVDVWAAGVIFLSILSSVYPFFKAPNDFVALAEIVTIFGDRAIRKTALALERMVTISQRSKPLNLRKLCLRFRHRQIFSDAQMIRKYETPDGRCDVCKNCDQYFFNCLCEDSEYVTEPLDPYECFPSSAYDLLARLLEINPHQRISAEEALQHPFFNEPPLPNNNAIRQSSLALTTSRRRTPKAPEGIAVDMAAVAGAAEEQLHPALNKL